MTKPIDPDGPPAAAVFCRLVGISRPRLTQLRQEGIIAGGTLAEWLRAYCDNLRRHAAARTPDELMKAARLRKAEAVAELAEMDAALRRKTLVEPGRLLDAFETSIVNAKTKLRGIPSRVAPSLVGEPAPVIFTRLLAEIDAVLLDLSKGTDRVGKEATGD